MFQGEFKARAVPNNSVYRNIPLRESQARPLFSRAVCPPQSYYDKQRRLLSQNLDANRAEHFHYQYPPILSDISTHADFLAECAQIPVLRQTEFAPQTHFEGPSYNEMLWSTAPSSYTNFVNAIQDCLKPKPKNSQAPENICTNSDQDCFQSTSSKDTMPCESAYTISEDSKSQYDTVSQEGKPSSDGNKSPKMSKGKFKKRESNISTAVALKLVDEAAEESQWSSRKRKTNILLDISALYSELSLSDQLKDSSRQASMPELEESNELEISTEPEESPNALNDYMLCASPEDAPPRPPRYKGRRCSHCCKKRRLARIRFSHNLYYENGEIWCRYVRHAGVPTARRS